MFNRILTALFLIVMLVAILYVYHNSNGTFHIAPLTSSVAAANANALPLADSVTGKPTISATFINRVLAYYHSPARGLGATIYALGVQYGIDPAYALAFFMHESAFGTQGVAKVTLSPGNLRCAPTFRCIGDYRAYASWTQGFQGWYQLIRNLYIEQWHKTTLQAIIPTYAPAGDGNNPATYITAVEQAVADWQAGKVEVA
ncbi:MAG TPA: glucosaminidase domain-containing protein [Ktedonobacteraceae bacterium]|nr:glucosaminidase domain-containing protein [Ktedonobacteraceae bacterium]